MPRVIGIDPGTVTLDLVGLHDGELFLDRSLATGEALARPDELLSLLRDAGPLDLIAGPSGYGLPLTPAGALTERDLRLAYLIAPGDRGGIGGLRTLARALGRLASPVVFTPGVVHLPTVAAHRKINRIDMGTADKVCAAVLAIDACAREAGLAPGEVSCILLELGGAFSAVLAIDRGAIVDGAGGTAGPLGRRAAGALDGEVAYLLGRVEKSTLFTGGLQTIAGGDVTWDTARRQPLDDRGRLAWEAYFESAAKAVLAMTASAPAATRVVVSGRVSGMAGVLDELAARLTPLLPRCPVTALRGFAREAAHAAQGAALMADGLCGGTAAPVVDALQLRRAGGTVLDWLHVITPAAARARLDAE